MARHQFHDDGTRFHSITNRPPRWKILTKRRHWNETHIGIMYCSPWSIHTFMYTQHCNALTNRLNRSHLFFAESTTEANAIATSVGQTNKYCIMTTDGTLEPLLRNALVPNSQYNTILRVHYCLFVRCSKACSVRWDFVRFARKSIFKLVQSGETKTKSLLNSSTIVQLFRDMGQPG